MKKNPLLTRLPYISLCIATMVAGAAGVAMAQSPTTQPQASNDLRALATELRDAKAAYTAQFGGPKALSSLRQPEERERLKQVLPPLAARIADLEKQVSAARSAAPVVEGQVRAIPRARVDIDGVLRNVVLIAIGNEETVAKAKADASGSDPVLARAAQAQVAAGSYFTAASPEEQLKAIETLKPVLQAAEGKESGVDVVATLIVSTSADEKISEQVSAAIFENKPGPYTQSVLRQRESAAKSKEVENKPVALAGTTVDGKAFSTADLKGKVILIDFWATWCGPCKAELPRIKGLYAKYKEQGFEIVGISSDRNKDALTTYLANDPELSWTNLFHEPQGDGGTLHPVAKEFKITGIPRYFLIDRKGVLRSGDARQQLETLIPKLLEESAG